MKTFKHLREAAGKSSVKSRGDAVKAARKLAKNIVTSVDKAEYYFTPAGDDRGEVDRTFLVNLAMQLEAEAKKRR